jgi:hypothetical protein
MSMKKVGNKLKVGRPKTGQTKAKISVSVDQKTLQDSLAKWQNRASTSGLVEMLLRGYVSGGLNNQPT